MFASVSQLLSSTTGLVELNIYTDTILCLSPAASLLTHLQGMPCLRRLQLWVLDRSSPIPVFNMRATDVVPLPKLTHFRFSGYTAWFEALAAGLAAPFLQDLYISLVDDSPTLPHLSRFIGDVEGVFPTIRVSIMICGLQIIMLTHSHNEHRRSITVRSEFRWPVQIGMAFGTRLTTAERLRFHSCRENGFGQDPISWRGFLEQFHNVKVLEVESISLVDVARFLLQYSEEPPLHLLPALEEIQLYSSRGDVSAIEHKVPSALSPFIAARKQAGHPVRISWNADLAD
jgi:hypothetical protein